MATPTLQITTHEKYRVERNQDRETIAPYGGGTKIISSSFA
jgi:hypothetical protein